MIVFDNWKFREILKSIVDKKELNGDRIYSKQQLYMRIGEALHVSPDTVKYWQRDKSSGPDPRTPELLKELEKYLGYPTGALQKKINIEEEKTEDKRMDKVSEFQKEQIMEIYEALKSFVSEMAIENEDEYYRIRAVIERKQLVLPETIFNATPITTLSPVEIGRMVVRGMNEQIQRLFQEEYLLEFIRAETQGWC